MSQLSDEIREHLRMLDRKHESKTLDAVELAGSVESLRCRRGRARSVVCGLATCGIMIVGVVWSASNRSADAPNVAMDEPGVKATTTDVDEIRAELEVLRDRSSQFAAVMARFDSLMQQQIEIDQRIDEMERQSREDAIRIEQSESLAINVTYDFGY